MQKQKICVTITLRKDGALDVELMPVIGHELDTYQVVCRLTKPGDSLIADVYITPNGEVTGKAIQGRRIENQTSLQKHKPKGASSDHTQ